MLVPMDKKLLAAVVLSSLTALAAAQTATRNARPRVSDLGLKIGILPAGPLDAITDVAGVEVGQTTIIRGDNIRTGVTAVLPHSGNLYREKVPGTGTVAFGWKGGIGTSSRRLTPNLGGYTVGVLVQTNYGGVLTIAGAPVGQELGQYYLRNELQQAGSGRDKADGSCMIVVATDAPLEARNLKRLAARAWLGIARTGSSGSNGSGDYVIAFSTAPQVRVHANDKALTRNVAVMPNDGLSPLFQAVIEATEEAVYNSMFKATTMTANGHSVEALPIDPTMKILKEHRVIR